MRPKQPASVADRRAGEHLGQPRGACEVGRAQGGRLGRRAVSGPALRVGEGQEQLTAEPRGCGGVRPERLDRNLVLAYRLLVREHGACAGSGPPGVVDRLLAVSTRGRLEEVMCELRQMGVEVRGVEDLEGLADLAVELYPATSRQTVVCGVPDQGVGEAHATQHAGDL